MTTQQLHLFNAFYLIVLVGVAVLTRATARRIAGALAGGAAFGVVALGIIALGERVGWWHMAIARRYRPPDNSQGVEVRVFIGRSGADGTAVQYPATRRCELLLG